MYTFAKIVLISEGEEGADSGKEFCTILSNIVLVVQYNIYNQHILSTYLLFLQFSQASLEISVEHNI